MKRHIQFVGIAAALAVFGNHAKAFHDKDNDFTAITKSLDTAIENQKDQAARLAKLEKTIDQQNAEILGDLQGSVKKALEGLEATRKAHYTFEERMNALKKANLALEMERKASYMTQSPLLAIMNNEEKAIRFLASVQKMLKVPISDCIKGRMAEMEIKLIGEDSGVGGNYINNELRNDIYNTLLTYGIYRKFKVIRTNTKETSLPLTTARPVASWVTTEGTGPSADSTKAGSLGSLTLGELLCNVPVSLRLIEDADIDIVGDLINDLGEAFAYSIDNTLFNAETTNNATYGGFNGIMNQAAVNTAAAGTTVATTTLADWLGTISALDAGVLQRGVAEWFIHPTIALQTLAILDTAGRPIFQTALDAPNARSIMSILGYPVNQTGVMPSTNSAAQKVALIGDPMGAAVGIRKDLMLESTDAVGWTNATRDFRGRLRAGVLVRKTGAFKVVKTHA